jgi:hypothetical protein
MGVSRFGHCENMNIQRLTQIAVLSSMVAACGGGSDSAGSTGNPGSSPAPSAASGATPNPASSSAATSVPAGTTQAISTYAASSVESAILTEVNGYRTQCGFPTLSQNTILDAAAKSHTDYQLANNFTITDTEVVGSPGFTGVTASDRAIAKGWPAGLPAATQNAGLINDNLTTDAQYGQATTNVWATGVYHQTAVTWLANLVGVGSSMGTDGGYKTVISGLVFSGDTSGSATIPTGNLPATFPCAGVTGIPAAGAGESPLPPGYETVHTVAGDILRWGTPVTVEGNLSDVVTLTRATYTAPDGVVTQLNLVTSANDPAKLTGTNKVVAYPTNALASNTAYNVDLAGTLNGTAFAKHFTFTTGN